MDKKLASEIEKKKNGDSFFIDVNMDVCWWASLGSMEIRELAYILSKNAVVLWNNYNFPGDIKNKINSVKSLPVNALNAIESILDKENESVGRLYLNKIFKSFVTPVIQFRDDELQLPYEVKSAFLSVFDLLKGMLSVKNQFVAVQCFSSSITRSFDAIKISNIFSQKEISVLTQKYLLLSAGK